MYTFLTINYFVGICICVLSDNTPKRTITLNIEIWRIYFLDIILGTLYVYNVGYIFINLYLYIFNKLLLILDNYYFKL